MGLKYVDVYHYYWIGFEGSLMRDQEGLMFHMSGCYLILPKKCGTIDTSEISFLIFNNFVIRSGFS